MVELLVAMRLLLAEGSLRIIHIERTQNKHTLSELQVTVSSQKILKWFELEGTLKLIQSQPPAMSRDTFL